jgi:hypothetical protein
MKKLLVCSLTILLTASSTLAQRWSPEWGLNYVYTAPLGSMKYNIRQGNGVTLDFSMLTPSRHFSIGMEVRHTQYGFDKSMQQYDMDDGTTADMEVTVSNSFTDLVATGRYYLVTKGKIVPYLSAKGGYSYYHTDLTIYDPDDNDHCEPVESDLLHRDGTLIGSLGAGFRFDFSTLIKRMKPGQLFIDLSANVTQGGTVKYMNTDAPAIHSANHDAMDAVEAEFINTQTQVIHSHHVGSLYSSPVQLMDFKFGISYRIER